MPGFERGAKHELRAAFVLGVTDTERHGLAGNVTHATNGSST
jgi:hypothetical protein